METTLPPVETSLAIIPNTAALSNTLHFLRVNNALMPTAASERISIEWHPCKTVAEYLGELYPLGYDLLSISLNGRVLSAVERQHVIPRTGDFLVASPLLQGGQVWRTLAQVAVMAAAVAASIFLGPEFVALGWAATATMGTAMAAVTAGLISIGGSLLINTFMGATPATKNNQPSWAFSGPQTLAQPGVVIPKGYGTYRSAGNIIASFVDIEGSNQYINALVCYGFGPARSISNLQINGKSIANYRNVQYYTRLGSNDQQPIPAFNRVVNGYPQDVQVTCDGGPVVVPGTGTLTQALQVDIQFPLGVYYISGAGNQLPCKIVYRVEYSQHGSGVWNSILAPKDTQDVVFYNGDGSVNWSSTPRWVLLWTGGDPASGVVLKGDNGAHRPGDVETVVQTVTTYDQTGSSSSSSKSFKGEWQPIDITVNQVKVTSWWDGWVQYVNDTTEAVYNRTSIYGLTPGKYDVRVLKWGSNNADNFVSFGDYDSPKRGQQVWIHSVNEITYQDLSYPNMILVGVRALATNQLSGSGINITADITYGLRTLDNNVLPAALQAFEEDNPACVAADMMLDDLYGGGQALQLRPANIERFIDEWLAWAKNCDTLVPDGSGTNIRLARFNGIFDNEGSLWEQVQAVGRMSRAAVIPMGRDYGVFVNAADVPVQMFTVGNIKQDSYEETWLAIDDRANQVEVEFADATRYYRTDNPIVYMDAADQAAGVAAKNVRVRGTGITSPAQAWHYGHFLGVSNKLLLRTGKIDAPVDAIACRPGNLVILQHDVPQWGWGGRTLPNSTATKIIADRNDLPWDGTTAYNVIVLYPSLQRYEGALTSAAVSVDSTGATVGWQIGLSSFDGLNRVTRAVIAGHDCAILSYSGGTALVQPPPGFTPAIGMAYTLYDTDVMITASVSGVAAGDGNTQVITLGVALPAAPPDFATYFYGQPGSQKVVRVTNITRKSDEQRTIEWIDEDSGCYTPGTPVVGETSAQITTDPNVINLAAAEIFQVVNGNFIDAIQLTWKNGPNTAGVQIYGQYPGLANPKLLARVTGKTDYKFPVATGVQWTFTVVGFDADDHYATWNDAPSVTITAQGVTTNLLQDSSFQSGFSMWNLTARASDVLAPTFANDGEAQYTVVGSAITSLQWFLNQVVMGVSGSGAPGRPRYFHMPPSGQSGASRMAGWQVGDYLMLSAYFETNAGAVGTLCAKVGFLDNTGAWLLSADASLPMNGTAQTLTRVHSAPIQVPAGTAEVRVYWYVDTNGGALNIPVGTVLKASHFLLEKATPTQTAPHLWADVDASGKVIDVFQIGSSSNMRTQGSTLPAYTGSFPYTYTDTTITLAWADLQIQWPDGGITEVMDGIIGPITGLTAATRYYAYLYFDVINGGVKAVTPANPVGGILSATIDYAAAAQCRMDGRVPLTGNGLLIVTAGSGGSGSGSGSGISFVQVSPGSANIGSSTGGGTFSAQVTLNGIVVPGAAVTWSATGGSIDSSGHLIGPGGGAPHGGGSVIATSVDDPSASGGAGFYW